MQGAGDVTGLHDFDATRLNIVQAVDIGTHRLTGQHQQNTHQRHSHSSQDGHATLNSLREDRAMGPGRPDGAARLPPPDGKGRTSMMLCWSSSVTASQASPCSFAASTSRSDANTSVARRSKWRACEG